LHLRWTEIDFERGLLRLSDSKTGKRPIILNAPALAILADLPRASDYVIAGNDPKKPRADIKRPWEIVRDRAGLCGVRLHDLRHNSECRIIPSAAAVSDKILEFSEGSLP
jgi:integrase